MFRFPFEEPMALGPYSKSLKCFPVIMMAGKERKEVDRGGKIILPASALDHLTRLHIQFPMLFKLNNRSKSRETHCGVLEFVAEEGRCYLPYWMMRNLLLNEGELIQVEYVNLEIAKFAKFQPQSVDFLEISNPKAVLENSLRNFATLTKGDVISINYNDKDYEVCILETRPGNAVSIIECDMDVDFAAPVGYQEPAKDYGRTRRLTEPSNSNFEKKRVEETKPQNEGYRLDGKPRKKPLAVKQQPEKQQQQQQQQPGGGERTRGQPFYEYKVGLLRLNRNFVAIEDETSKNAKEEKVVKGHKLKHIGMAS
jgi:ubiquitin fusion degradation protein 1